MKVWSVNVNTNVYRLSDGDVDAAVIAAIDTYRACEIANELINSGALEPRKFDVELIANEAVCEEGVC